MIDATANGVSFLSIGLGLIKHNIPVLPPTRDYNVQLAGRDGEIDFGADYGPRVFNLECVVMADDTTFDYHRRVAQVAALFNAKRGDIAFEFEDLPGRTYYGRYAGTMEIEKLLFDGMVTIPVKMHDPFPKSPERIKELTITASPQSIEINSDSDDGAQPVIVLTNTGANTIRRLQIANIYQIE